MFACWVCSSGSAALVFLLFCIRYHTHGCEEDTVYLDCQLALLFVSFRYSEMEENEHLLRELLLNLGKKQGNETQESICPHPNEVRTGFTGMIEHIKIPELTWFMQCKVHMRIRGH